MKKYSIKYENYFGACQCVTIEALNKQSAIESLANCQKVYFVIAVQSSEVPDQPTTFNDFNQAIRKQLLPKKIRAKKTKIVEQVWSKNRLKIVG